MRSSSVNKDGWRDGNSHEALFLLNEPWYLSSKGGIFWTFLLPSHIGISCNKQWDAFKVLKYLQYQTAASQLHQDDSIQEQRTPVSFYRPSLKKVWLSLNCWMQFPYWLSLFCIGNSASIKQPLLIDSWTAELHYYWHHLSKDEGKRRCG